MTTPTAGPGHPCGCTPRELAAPDQYISQSHLSGGDLHPGDARGAPIGFRRRVVVSAVGAGTLPQSSLVALAVQPLRTSSQPPHASRPVQSDPSARAVLLADEPARQARPEIGDRQILALVDASLDAGSMVTPARRLGSMTGSRFLQTIQLVHSSAVLRWHSGRG